MEITMRATDLAVAVLAVIGAILAAAAALAVLVRVLGRKVPEIEESLATWLLRDAAGWRAREAGKRELANHRPVLAPVVEGEAA